MVVGRVERREVVVLELDLGALRDAEAEPDEDVLDLALDLRQEVGGASRHGVAGERDVDRLGAQCLVELAAACDRLWTIPLAGAESLNVAAAAAIALGRISSAARPEAGS